MRDIKNLRKMVSSIQVPSILPLDPNEKNSDEENSDEKNSDEEERRVPGSKKMNRLFLLRDGNCMELDAHVVDRTLHISIITTSDDGSRIDDDKAHRRGEIYMTATEMFLM